MIYLTAIGMLPGGSSTVHIYTQTIHTTTQRKNYFGRVWTVPRLCEFYPGICLTTDEKAQKNLCGGKKNLSQSTVYILPKHPHVLKPTHTNTHTLQNNIKPPQYKLKKQTQHKIYPNETVTI